MTEIPGVELSEYSDEEAYEQIKQCLEEQGQVIVKLDDEYGRDLINQIDEVNMVSTYLDESEVYIAQKPRSWTSRVLQKIGV